MKPLLIALSLTIFSSPLMAGALSDSVMPDTSVSSGGEFGAPKGMVGFFASTTCPGGWILANGQNGTPDVRGLFIRAADNGRGVDPGRAVNSYQNDSIPNHHHRRPGYALYNDSVNSGPLAGQGPNTLRDAHATDVSGPIHPPSVSSTIASESRPKNIALLACFKQ